MTMGVFSMMRDRCGIFLTALLLALAGCSITGNNFDPGGLSDLKPGQTTMPQAVYLLNAAPDKVYPQSDGTTLALWRRHVSVVQDAVYGGQEVLLQFGPDGRLMRLAGRHNLLVWGEEQRGLLGVPPPPDYVPPEQRQ
jgi:hypothetical protein